MSTTIKATVVALAVATGATSASADSLLMDLAAKGAIITTHGIPGAR